MSYVVFDLDQTLADISVVFYFLMSLTIKAVIKEKQPYMLPYFSEELQERLMLAYYRFVERIAVEEKSEHPLGILRPGILGIMRKIKKMYKIIKSVTIYSNNQYLPSLIFIQDLIHCSIGEPIIQTCIHWNHPCRAFDHYTSPRITKTWDTLKHILVEQGAPADLKPEQVFFFDDQEHPTLHESLQNHYYKVPEYQSPDSFDRIALIYADCLEEAKVNIYDLYGYLTDVLEEEMIYQDVSKFTMTDLIDLLRKMTRITPWLNIGNGIRVMKSALQDIKIHHQVIHHHKIYTRKNRRHTIKK